MTTVRTIKLKRSSQAYGDSSGSANLSSPAAPENAPLPDAAHTQPVEPVPPSAPSAPTAPAAVVQKTVSGKFTLWFMLIALCATIGLLIILGLQYSEKSFYKEAPSVWLPGK